jgi:hypothetical protein
MEPSILVSRPESKKPKMTGRPPLRARLMGLATVLGLARRGVFVPHRHADQWPAPGGGASYAAVERRMRAAEPAFRAHLQAIERFAGELLALGQESRPAPRWRQDWFPRLDAAAAYAMLRTRAPARLVEVGAGHSTRFYARAARDGALPTRIRAIDPAPRADLSRLPIELDRRTLQAAGLDAFRELEAGDVLSIDSSHILMPGSDVDLLLNRVLPELPAGVLVQIHDILLPDDYPAAWGWRGYNEQQGVAPLLVSPGWEVLWSSRWVATRMAGEVAAGVAGRLPLPTGGIEASLWLCKR